MTYTPSQRNPLAPISKWLTIINVILTLLLATLAGMAMRGGQPDMRGWHSDLGVALFVLLVIQAVLTFIQFSKKHVGIMTMGVNFLLLVDSVAQAGLGFAGISNPELWAWHLPNGLLMTILATVAAAVAWQQPTYRPDIDPVPFGEGPANR